MDTYTFVDNSNFYIEGQRLSAVKKGMAKDMQDAINRKIFDRSRKFDYGKFHALVCGDKKDIKKATLWGSPPPKKDTLWKMMEAEGFDVILHEKSFGKERRVDADIAYHLGIDSFGIDKINSEICLVAGDKDFSSVLEDLKKRGFFVKVYFWGQASEEIKRSATKFINLDDYFDELKK